MIQNGNGNSLVNFYNQIALS